jgi:hypothetical protein
MLADVFVPAAVHNSSLFDYDVEHLACVFRPARSLSLEQEPRRKSFIGVEQIRKIVFLLRRSAQNLLKFI